MLCPRSEEPSLQRGLAEGCAQALSRYAAGGRVGEREDPVLPARAGGVVLDPDSHHHEDAAELLLVSGKALRDAHPVPDVRHPRVAARRLGPSLGSAAVGLLQGARFRSGLALVCRESLEARAGLGPFVAERPESPLGRHLLERPVEIEGVVGMHPPACDHVRVVHDDVRMGDAVFVVVVVDDCDVVLGKEVERPCVRQLPELIEAHFVFRGGRQHEMLEGAGPLPVPWIVVAAFGSEGVHFRRPIEGLPEFGLAHEVRVRRLGEIEEVARERAPVLLEVPLDRDAVSVSRYGLQHWHPHHLANIAVSSRDISSHNFSCRAFTASSFSRISGRAMSRYSYRSFPCRK